MISHEHKVVFIHVPKCAGTSIEKALGHFDEPFFRAQDHRAVRQLEPLSLRSFVGKGNRRQLKRRFENPRLPYPNPKNKLTVTRDQWHSYFKFTVVRNPWSRTFSAYRAFLRNPKRRAKLGLPDNVSFDEFCEKCLPGTDLTRSQTFWLLGANGKLGVDRAVRFHHLQEEMDQISEEYGLPLKNLPNLLNHKPADYREVYTDRTRNIVASVYAEEIALFDFHFNDEAEARK